MVKRIFYFLIKKDWRQTFTDLKNAGYLPERGELPWFLKIVEYAQAEQEMSLIRKDILRIIGDRGELLLVK